MRQPIDTVIAAEYAAAAARAACAPVRPSPCATAVVTGEWSLGCGHCGPRSALTELSRSARTRSGSASRPWPRTSDQAARGRLPVLMRSRRSPQLPEETGATPGPRGPGPIATTALSGTNCQPWTFTIAPDRAAVERLAAAGGFFERLNCRPRARPIARWLACWPRRPRPLLPGVLRVGRRGGSGGGGSRPPSTAPQPHPVARVRVRAARPRMPCSRPATSCWRRRRWVSAPA
jgi:hypothetical protein